MLLGILESAGLNPKNCADLLGLDHKLFSAWLKGEKPIPGFIVPELSTVLGVTPEQITSSRKSTQVESADAPSIWFKFRAGDKLTDADRETVLVIRKLGHFIDQMEELTQSRPVSWKLLFDMIRRDVSKQASPKEQGKQAAILLRSARSLGFPNTSIPTIRGIGDILRENLRHAGIRIVETPLQVSNLEGCCFYVGAPGDEKPCLFANAYKQTWFRRNMVLAHELGHAIFDIEASAASLDFNDDSDAGQLQEIRAQSFAQEVLAPRELLNHLAQTLGLKWHDLTPRDVALIVAYAQVEQRVVVKSALDGGFITAELADKYRQLDIYPELRQLTERVLSTREFIELKKLDPQHLIPAESRTTTIPSRALRLPLPYVAKVLDLVKSQTISAGKGAQMLMVDRSTFVQRFETYLGEVQG